MNNLKRIANLQTCVACVIDQNNIACEKQKYIVIGQRADQFIALTLKRDGNNNAENLISFKVKNADVCVISTCKQTGNIIDSTKKFCTAMVKCKKYQSGILWHAATATNG